MNVGDIFVSIRGDGAPLKADAVKASTEAGDAGGKAFSDRFGGAVRTGFTALTAGAGAIFGGLSMLANQGTNAMATFQAQTGATAAEAKDAFASMNRLAGENLQTFDQVSAAFTSVTTNLGLTGKAAEDATNLILKFSTATGTDAVANVSAFDDVLDSWGKTADDLPAIMDQIVGSTQKFGGSATEATSALVAMAPALRGMGASLEDGIGLLDLFRASGLNASDAASSLNKAVKNLKPGQTLDDLIAQVGAIENPTLRSQKAIELFGKTGAKLGNAIKPGMTSLAEFKVSAKDVGGAMTDAADVIENTFPNKIKIAVAGALSSLRDLGTSLGPAITGAASLVSLGTSFASALKLDSAIAGAFSKAANSQIVASAMSGAGKLMGGKLATGVGLGIAAVATGILVDVWTKALTDANEKIRNDPANVEILKGVGGRAPVWAEVRRQAAAEAEKVGKAALDAFNAAWDRAIANDPGNWQKALADAIAAGDLAGRLEHMWSPIPPVIDNVTDAQKRLRLEQAASAAANDEHANALRQQSEDMKAYGLLVQANADGVSVSIEKAAHSFDTMGNAIAPVTPAISNVAGAFKTFGSSVGHTVQTTIVPALREIPRFAHKVAFDTIGEFDWMQGGIVKQLKQATADAKTQVDRLWYAIKHPGERKENLDALATQIARAHRAGLAAQKKGDAAMVAEAATLAAKLQAEWNRLNMHVTIDVSESIISASRAHGKGGRAAGGPVPAGWLGLVGENGPELFGSAYGGRVLSHADLMSGLRSMMLGGSGNAVTVRHEFGPIRVDGNVSPAAGREIGRGIGDTLGETIAELGRMRSLPLGSSAG